MVSPVIETMLLRVLSVRVQNGSGAIFRGECIQDTGEIADTHREVVARLHARAVGTKVQPGQWWKISGEVAQRTYINAGGFEMTEHQIDVKAGYAFMTMPSGFHIVDYLARNQRFEGIGQISAQRLWERFQDRLVEVLDREDSQALESVVSPTKARILIDAWRDEGMGETLQWLQANEVGAVVGRRAVEYFGRAALGMVKENPYRLLSFAAGWPEVDGLAMRALGVKPSDPRRLVAAVEETVYRKFSLGDTFVPLADLVGGVKRLLRDEPGLASLANTAVDLCEKTARLLFDSQRNAYSLGASVLEDAVVDCIVQRMNMISPPCHVDEIIAAHERKEGSDFKLNPEQLAAAHLVADNHFSVVTGGAGCGKTTVLKAMCHVLEAQGYEIIQTALAGKAVKRMRESTDRPAKTLAALIKEYSDAKDGTAGKYKLLAVLIDEASMVDLLSFSALARKLHGSAKIVLIGDPHQLPPIGPGLILHCLVSGNVPHVELIVGKRFGGDIAHAANLIRGGMLPSNSDQGAVRMVEVADHDMANAASKYYLLSPLDTIVLSATRQIAKVANQLIQAALSKGAPEVLTWNDRYECMQAEGFKVGDALICTRNRWAMGLQNGSMGRLLSTWEEKEDGTLGEIAWDDGSSRTFDRDLLQSLELGYALTVHKSQGSQWKRVVVCLPAKSRMIDRSLVYTAVTRAQCEVVLLTSSADLCVSVALEKAADRRFVGLPKRLLAAGIRPALTVLH